MTKEEFEALLKKTGIPVFWHHANAGEPLPIIVYFSDHTANISADSRVYLKIPIYDVAIYTTESSGDKEIKLLESLLDEANLFYDRFTEYDEQSRVWANAYANILL